MKYRKRPVVVDAIQYIGINREEVWRFVGTPLSEEDGELIIPTREGGMLARPGDFIIRGVNGEYYPCKPDIFAKTYEAVLPPGPGD